jgi:hypothetical protein
MKYYVLSLYIINQFIEISVTKFNSKQSVDKQVTVKESLNV